MRKRYVTFPKEELYSEALRCIEEYNLFFMHELIAFMPCPVRYFNEAFPEGSQERIDFYEVLDKNKVAMCAKLRKDFLESSAPQLKLALYKLAASKEELQRLTKTYSENENRDTLRTTFVIQQVNADPDTLTPLPPLASSEGEVIELLPDKVLDQSNV